MLSHGKNPSTTEVIKKLTSLSGKTHPEVSSPLHSPQRFTLLTSQDPVIFCVASPRNALELVDFWLKHLQSVRTEENGGHFKEVAHTPFR